MPQFERPTGSYAGSAGANRSKYQDDSAAVPKRAISSSKVDGDLNYILDALNTIWGLNASGAYTDLQDSVAQIRQNQLDIASLVTTGFITPSGTNVVAYSANGTDWTSGKVTNALLRDSAGLSVIGRSANSSGAVADITAASDGDVLFRNGSTLTFGALPATRVTFNNGASGMAATTVQAAIDELDGRLDNVSTANLAASGTTTLSGTISPTALAANTDNWAPTGLSGASVIRASASAAYNLTGLTGGAAGRIVLLENVGANAITLTHDATSTAANRFFCPANVDFSLAAGASVWLQYDSTSSRWRVVAPFTSALFTNQLVYTSSNSWVVPSGITKIFYELWGAGAGGGGSSGAGMGSGGGAGAYACGYKTVTPGETITITVGANGTGGNTSGTNGTNGGNTSIAGISGTNTANGGSLGTGATGFANLQGGAGGTTSGVGYGINGQPGFDGQAISGFSNGTPNRPNGGDCPRGGGGGKGGQTNGGSSPVIAGSAGVAPGGGGGGGNGGGAGGNGASGCVVISY